MLKAALKSAVNRLGYNVTKRSGQPPTETEAFLATLTQEERTIWDEVKPHTMTSVQRIVGLLDAVRYICSAHIPGAIVECGVWRGGSMMVAAKLLVATGSSHHRHIFLFDTFDGTPNPTVQQNDYLDGAPASY